MIIFGSLNPSVPNKPIMSWLQPHEHLQSPPLPSLWVDLNRYTVYTIFPKHFFQNYEVTIGFANFSSTHFSLSRVFQHFQLFLFFHTYLSNKSQSDVSWFIPPKLYSYTVIPTISHNQFMSVNLVNSMSFESREIAPFLLLK